MPRSWVLLARHRELPIAVVLAAFALVASAALSARSPGVLGTEPADAKTDGPCPYAHTGPMHLNQAQASESILCLINKKRAAHGKGPLTGNGNLTTAAQRHSDHMVGRRCFDHTCPGEVGMQARIKSTGYLNGANSMGLGENIAAGGGPRGKPAKIVRGWMRSHPHRVTLLKGGFEHLGVGMTHGTPWKPKSGGATYTADFGYLGG
jgi:uncharacterized protein YkwD